MTVVNEKPQELGWSLGNGVLRLEKHLYRSEAYWTGEFMHPSGVVSILRQSDLTRLDLVAGGRGFSWSWPRYFGDRTIRRLAREMLIHFGGAA